MCPQIRLRFVPLIVLVALVALLWSAVLPAVAGIPVDSYILGRRSVGGRELVKVIVPGRPPDLFRMPAATVPTPHPSAGTNSLSSFPVMDWCYGCSATSAAMAFGWYDTHGYPDFYTGPTNGGLFPLNNATWGYGECPLSASHNGIDGRSIRGHVDDYWISYGSGGPDPYDGHWTEHTPSDCTGDFMGTNQDKFGNTDGSTTFYFWGDGRPFEEFYLLGSSDRDGCQGMETMAQSLGYTVLQRFNQYIYGYNGNSQGFTYAQYQAEVDAGRPVLIQVSGHTMIGFGYNTASDLVYLCDTWDHSYHSMVWGADYYGMDHYGVTVFRMAINDPVINFPDANLEAAVREAVGKPTGDIYASDVDDLTALDAHGRSIVNLSGLEYFESIEILNLADNSIVNPLPLQGLATLLDLDLSGNSITTCQRLQYLRNLTHLNISDNSINSVWYLAGMADLEVLLAANNSITSITPIAGLAGLRELDISGNAVTDLGPMSAAAAGPEAVAPMALAGLQVLDASANGIVDISALATLTTLQSLELGDNQIWNVAAIGSLTQLSSLGLAGNQVGDISALAGNAGIAAGDTVALERNWLDLTAGTQAHTDLQTLLGRSVTVTYDDQTPHQVVFDSAASGDPNPCGSRAQVQCTVEARDVLGYDVTYQWEARDGGGVEAGAFNDATLREPVWTAPANLTGTPIDYTLEVTVTTSHPDGTAAVSAYTQAVESGDHWIEITDGPAGTPDTVASGGDVACSVSADDSLIGHTVDYTWTATDGNGDPAGSFDDAAAQNPTWTAPANLSDDIREYLIHVVASCHDDASISAFGSFTVQVHPVAHTVALTAGPAADPSTVESAGTTNLTCAASDSREGHTVAYLWTAQSAQGDSVGGFSDPNAQNPTWTAPANISDNVKQYTVTVLAYCTDHPEVNDTDTCIVRVNPVPHEITITDGPVGTPNPRSSGGAVLCGVHAQDSRGHSVTYLWAATDGNGGPAGAFDDATLQFPSWTAPENLTGAAIAYEITVTVSCANAPAVNASASFTVFVNPVGHHVTITEGPVADPNPVASGGQVDLSAAAIDSRDGHTVNYTWTAQDMAGNPAGAFDDANAQNPVWTAPENQGDHTARYTITCTATCDEDAGVTGVGTVIVNVSPVDHAVTITAGPQGDPNPAEAGDQVQCSVTAQCSRAGHALQYAWTARDGSGAAAGSFSNATAPNPVWHAPASVPAENNEYQISVTVSCQSDPSVRATASFAQQVTRPTHAIEFTQPPQGPGAAVNSGATMQCAVDAIDTHGHAVTYLWTATDADGDPAGSFNNPSLQHPRWTAPANETGAVAECTLTVTVTCSEDNLITLEASFVQEVRPVAMHTFASGARMIGVPVQSDTPPDVQAAAGIADAMWWNPALPAYVPHNAADPFVAARGYWARFLGATTMVVHGTSVNGDVDRNFDDGWHLIASPYQYELGLDAIANCANLKPYAWTDQGSGYELVAALDDALNAVHTSISPWWGYWVDADGPGTLHWSPAQAAAGSAPVELLQIGAADADRGGWQIQLVAEAGGRVDACNFLGIAGDATARALDIANPPLNPESVDLYFAAGARPMAADIRPLASTDLGWDFVVTSGVDGPVTLSFPDLSGVPAQYRLTLTDVASGKSLNMRTARAYEYSGVGTRAFRIEATRGNGNTLTVSTADARQLNSAAATVTYSLSAAADVTVDIRNIAGRCVTQIACGQAAAGANTATWNLCGAGGARVPAGTYLCTITARADDGTQASAVRALSVRR